MITKRIIPCLNVRNENVLPAGTGEGAFHTQSPVELALKYAEQGADELLFYDLSTSAEDRNAFMKMIQMVTRSVFIPLTVGGGITKLSDFERILACGGDKVSVKAGAVKYPHLVEEAAKKYGDQCVVLTVDVKMVKGAYHVFVHGQDTGLDAIEFIRRSVGNGAGEVVVNSLNTCGKKDGFNLPLMEKICEEVTVPVIASGGAGKQEDFARLFQSIPKIDAALASTAFHFEDVKIDELKNYLHAEGLNVRHKV